MLRGSSQVKTPTWSSLTISITSNKMKVLRKRQLASNHYSTLILSLAFLLKAQLVKRRSLIAISTYIRCLLAIVQTTFHSVSAITRHRLCVDSHRNLLIVFFWWLDANPRHVRQVHREKYKNKDVFGACLYQDSVENNYQLAKNDLCIIKLDGLEATPTEV